jgi:hypothetical protein
VAKAIVGCKIWFPHGSVGSIPTTRTNQDALPAGHGVRGTGTIFRRSMRFTKTELLETFDREDTSYRLAYLCTLWLRKAARIQPSAADQARGLQMKARGKWITYSDLAEKLESHSDLYAIVSDFNLTHLHTLIRAPLEMLRDYCEDYDKESYKSVLRDQLHATPNLLQLAAHLHLHAFDGRRGRVSGREKLPDQRADDRRILRVAHQEHGRCLGHQRAALANTARRPAEAPAPEA